MRRKENIKNKIKIDKKKSTKNIKNLIKRN